MAKMVEFSIIFSRQEWNVLNDRTAARATIQNNGKDGGKG